MTRAGPPVEKRPPAGKQGASNNQKLDGYIPREAAPVKGFFSSAQLDEVTEICRSINSSLKEQQQEPWP